MSDPDYKKDFYNVNCHVKQVYEVEGPKKYDENDWMIRPLLEHITHIQNHLFDAFNAIKNGSYLESVEALENIEEDLSHSILRLKMVYEKCIFLADPIEASLKGDNTLSFINKN